MSELKFTTEPTTLERNIKYVKSEGGELKSTTTTDFLQEFQSRNTKLQWRLDLRLK